MKKPMFARSVEPGIPKAPWPARRSTSAGSSLTRGNTVVGSAPLVLKPSKSL